MGPDKTQMWKVGRKGRGLLIKKKEKMDVGVETLVPTTVCFGGKRSKKKTHFTKYKQLIGILAVSVRFFYPKLRA